MWMWFQNEMKEILYLQRMKFLSVISDFYGDFNVSFLFPLTSDHMVKIRK